LTNECSFWYKNAVTRRHGAAALFLCLALLASCGKAPRTATALPKPAVTVGNGSAAPAVPAAPSVQAGPSSQPVASAPAATTVPTSPLPKQNTITLKKEEALPAQTLPAAVNAGVQTLLTLDGTPRILPEDFRIGPLGDPEQGTADEKAALEAAGALLASLVGGGVDAKLLAAESEEALRDMLAFGFEGARAPTSFRLGRAVARPEGETTVNARLFRGQGTAEGEIYLRKENREWLIADIQISAAELAAARERPKQKFFPSTYRWLLGE
jgi:hypothetical protein